MGDEAFLAEFRNLGGLNIDANHPAANYEAERLSRLAEERVIGRVLLLQRAAAAGMTVTPEDIERRRAQDWGTSSASVCGAGVRQAIGESLLLEQYCNWITRHEPRASRAEVEAYYQGRREDFRAPEQVNLMHIVRNVYLPLDEAPALVAIESARQQLDAGISFQKVADRYSDCGGRIALGWVRRGDMVPAFEEVAFATPKGQRSDIFRTAFGFHIVHVLDRKAAGYEPLDSVRTMLAKHLLQVRRDRRIHTEITEAMRSAIILTPAADQEGSMPA